MVNDVLVQDAISTAVDNESGRIFEIHEDWQKAIEPVGSAIIAWNKIDQSKHRITWGMTMAERLNCSPAEMA
jgi:hypothetical protein